MDEFVIINKTELRKTARASTIMIGSACNWDDDVFDKLRSGTMEFYFWTLGLILQDENIYWNPEA